MNLPFSCGKGNWCGDWCGNWCGNWCIACSLQSDAGTEVGWCSEYGWCSVTLRKWDGLWLNSVWSVWWQSQWWHTQRWQCPWIQTQSWDRQYTSTGTESQSQHDYNWCELQNRNELILSFSQNENIQFCFVFDSHLHIGYLVFGDFCYTCVYWAKSKWILFS